MKWQLQRLRFLQETVGTLIDPEIEEIRQRARDFSTASGLDKVEQLIEPPASGSVAPDAVLRRLIDFFSLGVLATKTVDLSGNVQWTATDLFWRGSFFHLDPKDCIDATGIVANVSPLDCKRSPAQKILYGLNLDFLSFDQEGFAYLLRPTNDVAYILLSDLAQPWELDHIEHTRRLVAKAFVY